MADQRRVPIALIGPSSKASSLAQQSGRTVNLYPEINDPDAKAVIALKHVPGYFRWADLQALIGADPAIRAMHVMGDRFFCVCAEKIYEVVRDPLENTFASLTTLGTLSTFTGRVGVSDNAGQLQFGDGTGFYNLNLDTLALTPVLNDESEQILGYISLNVNGQTLYFERDGSIYRVSDVGVPTAVNGLSFFSAEASSDYTVNAHVLGDQVVILGQETVEWHYNSGDADNPFQRISGGWVEHGSISRWSNCKFDNSVVMVGRNKEGNGIVWRLGGAGSAPVRISTHAVEKCLEKVLFAFDDVTESVTMWAYQDAGHSFCVLNLPAVPATVNNPAQPSMTWVYDAATNMWHERAYTEPETGQFERILSDFHVVWKNRHYTGSYQAAHIYEMSLDYYRENELALVKMRESAGPLSMGGRRFRVDKLGIEMEVGVGRDGGVQGSDPQIMLQVRWGQGAWSNVMYRSFGKMGEGKTLVQFGPLGSGTDLTIRVTISDPVRVTLTGAWADVTVGR